MGLRAGMAKKGIVILGSTGSVGVSSLDIMGRHPERFEVVGLTAWENVALLKSQILKYRPKIVAVGSEQKAQVLRSDVSLKGTDVYGALKALLR